MVEQPRQRPVDPPPAAGHAALPAWIAGERVYTRAGERAALPARLRATLQAIADAGALQADGGYIARDVGQRWREVGTSRATWWRHVRALEARGYLRTVATGHGRGQRTTYTIPGDPPGDQAALFMGVPPDTPPARLRLRAAELFQNEAPQNEAPQNETIRATRRPGETCGVARELLWFSGKSKPPSAEGTSLQSGTFCASKTRSGVRRQRGLSKTPGGGRRGTEQARLHDVRLSDLGSLVRLRELYVAAVRKRLLGESEGEWHLFVACAVHALRLGEEPPRMFMALVRRRRFLLPECDQDRADAWIKRVELEEGGLR